MTPKEKAIELVEKYYTELKEHKGCYDYETSKQCALICIDEQIELLKKIQEQSINIHQALSTPKKLFIDILNPIMKELEQLKQEINNL